MSTPDAADQQPLQDPAPRVDAPAEAVTDPAAPQGIPAGEGAEGVPGEGEEASDAGAAGVEPEPVVVVTEREVVLQRSVRYSRLLIGGAAVGAIVAILTAVLFPVAETADYTLGQAAGFVALIGAVVGLCLGGVLGLILGAVARRSSGRGVAIQSDVR